MRLDALMLITFLSLWAMIPLAAQSVLPKSQPRVTKVAQSVPGQLPGQARPEAVVARLMSFDTNHDGRVTRDELPERMQALLVRGDVTKDGAIDGAEVMRLAQTAPAQAVAPGLQPGHYGFGEDNGFDTRLHIDSAIEDLRLASVTREKALGIGRRFVTNRKAQAKAELLAAAEPLLSTEQMATFRATVDRAPAAVKLPVFVERQAASGPGGAALALNMEAIMANAQQVQLHLTRLVAQYQVTPDVRRQLQAAVARFKAHDRLSEAERTMLVRQMRGVLNDQERDDLRAALERRPIIKQQGLIAGLIPRQVPPPPSTPFKVQDLVLHQ